MEEPNSPGTSIASSLSFEPTSSIDVTNPSSANTDSPVKSRKRARNSSLLTLYSPGGRRRRVRDGAVYPNEIRRPGYVLIPRPPISPPALEDAPNNSSLSASEEEYIALLKCRAILLRFSKDCRLALHALKQDFIRLNLWADVCSLHTDICQSEKSQAGKIRATANKIRAQLPARAAWNYSNLMRTRTNTSSRNWSIKLSQKLRDIVAEALLFELIELQCSDLPQSQRSSRRLNLREQYAKIGNEALDLTNYDHVGSILKELNAKLRDSGKTTDEVAEFWQNFWDNATQALGNTPIKSSRECQIHWTHFHHPKTNRNEGWTREEEAALLKAIDELGDQRWEEIAARLGTGKTGFSVYRHYQLALNPTLATAMWTPEEEQQLVRLVDQYKADRARVWARVASHFEHKTNEQCRAKYEKKFRGTVKQGSWSIEEDLRLQCLVGIFGRGYWMKIAELMPERTDMKCRERYENLLAPEVRKQTWSADDDRKLLELVARYGSCSKNWAKIAEQMEGRTDADCNKRWQKLEPLKASREGVALRAARNMFIPNNLRIRGELPALSPIDFAASAIDHLADLTKRFEGAPEPTISEKKLYRKIFRAQSGFYEDKLNPDTDSSVSTISSSGYLEGCKRLALLKFYLSQINLGNDNADSQLCNAKKLITRARCNAFQYPHEAIDLYGLSEGEKIAIHKLLDAGLTADDCTFTDKGHLECLGFNHMTAADLEVLSSLKKALCTEFDVDVKQDVATF